MPSTKEEQRSQTGDRHHVAVLGHKEHGKFHSAVLGVVAGYEFRLRFRQIKWNTVGFRVGRHDVNEEGNKLEAAEEVPVEDRPRLRIYNLPQAQRSGKEQDSDQRQSQRNLVTNKLRAGSKRS